MKQNKDKQIRELRKELDEEYSRVGRGFWLLLGFLLGLILMTIFISIFPTGDEIRLEQDLESCQEKVPEDLKEVNITIEGFDKIKLSVWCWSKGYPNFDGNDSRIWEIIKNCEVISE